MAYRPITPIKGPGIAAVSALYDEQQDARQGQVEIEAGIRAADPTRGRRRTLALVGLVLASVAIVALAVALLPRSGPAATPAAVTGLATLAGTAPSTTTFDGQRYTISFTAANPAAIFAVSRTFADKHGYTFDTPGSGGPVALGMTGPQGGVALVYFDTGQMPNTPVRIVVAASDLTADGSALR